MIIITLTTTEILYCNESNGILYDWGDSKVYNYENKEQNSSYS